MGFERNRRMNRVSAELLLSGDPAVSGDLADLLTAAAFSAPAGAVAGEDAATAAFRAARHEPLRDRSALRSAMARLLTAKIAALLVVVLGAGVAVAATTGVLPNPLRTHPTTTPRPGRTTERPKPAPSPTSPGRPGQPPTGPTTDLHGLCMAYTAQLAAGHDRVLDNPAFGPLVAAAGGTSQVAAYCGALPAIPSASTTPGHPGAASTSHPTGKPGTAPAGGPSAHPTGRPTTHPGDVPSTQPRH